jgi:hypothetical protein
MTGQKNIFVRHFFVSVERPVSRRVAGIRIDQSPCKCPGPGARKGGALVPKLRPVNTELSHAGPERVWVDFQQGRRSSPTFNSPLGQLQYGLNMTPHDLVQ